MLLLWLSLLAEDAPKPKPAVASAALREAFATVALQMQLLQSRAENLKRQACEDAGIRFSSCEVDWQTGTVTEAKPRK